MTRFPTGLAILAAAAWLAACTDSERAEQAATFGDSPAEITCWSFGGTIYEGRSTGKVEYADSGRISFVDASNDRFTTIEGDCRVVYGAGDEAVGPPRVESAAPPADASTPPA